MSGFLKTMFGDAGTVSVVTIVMAAEFLLAATGQMSSAAFLVPPLILAGTAWLAMR